MVLTYLLDLGYLHQRDLRRPRRARLEELERVHPGAHLEAVMNAAELARVFAVDVSEVPVDALMHTLRLAVGATIEAAREALRAGGPTLNLLGGFHHAGPENSGGFSVLNDIAVAIAAVRADGFTGRVVVFDFDAHPPDGTATALIGDDNAHIVSISGVAWDLDGQVDETVVAAGCDDATYLRALHAALGRCGQVDLAFVLAGGDVLAGDHFGTLGLTLAGAAARDVAVAKRLRGVPSVWLPAGGYHDDAWRVLATTATILSRGAPRPPRASYNPVRVRLDTIARGLVLHENAASDQIFEASDLDALFSGSPAESYRLLGYYSAEMLEIALHRYGVLAVIRRLGYVEPRVRIDAHEPGHRFILRGRASGVDHVLVEAIVDRIEHNGVGLLYVNWLTLRHPRAHFGGKRRALPGQDVPGLGMAKEAGELLGQMARRLGLAGVAFRPAAMHVAFAARYEFRFVDAARQAAFQALVRDLCDVGLGTLTRATAAGDVRCNGQPYRWGSDLMICWLDPTRRVAAADVDPIAQTLRFTLAAPVER